MSFALQLLLVLVLAVLELEGPPAPGGDLTSVTDQEIIRALSVLLTQVQSAPLSLVQIPRKLWLDKWVPYTEKDPFNLCHKDTLEGIKCLELCLSDIRELASATS